MAFALPSVGELLLLKYVLNHTVPDNARLHLYSNEREPSDDDVLSSYTECTAAGYASMSLNGSLWTFATAAGTTTASYPTRTFTFTTSATVNGYYMTNNAATQLIFAESFDDGPYEIVGTGYVAVDPGVRLRGDPS